jgi:glycosyltransferase involved in cell wall biosynthesis
MAASLPYVVSDTGELVNAVREAGTGTVVPVGDPAAVAAAIDSMIERPHEERLELGRRGRALVEERFSQERTAGQVMEVYRQAIAAD